MATRRKFHVSILGHKFETESEDWEGKSAEQIQDTIRAKHEEYFKLFGLKVDEIIIREIECYSTPKNNICPSSKK